jgi:flagellar biosynthetic protein FliR
MIPMGEVPIIGDAARHAVQTFAHVFALGVRMAVPLIILSFIFNLGIGLVNKMLPTLPVYFIAMPVSILGSFYVLAHATAPLLLAFRGAFASWLANPFA